MNGSEKHYLERLLDPEDRDMIEKEEHFSQVMMMYSCAIREVQTKLEVLNDDLKSRYQRNPIHSIKSRIKKPVSLAKKLRKKGLPVSVDSIKGISMTLPVCVLSVRLWMIFTQYQRCLRHRRISH